jgi:UDP-2,3-diacylglucosamine pyrophosphatase LpxH
VKRHTVVLSDIHLGELEPGDALWMRYRQREQAPDAAFAAMIDALLGRIEGEPRPSELTLVLNGDILDFDAPHVVDGESVFHDDPRDDAHSVPYAEAVLRDHPGFVDAVARVLARGHKVVLVSGNHDAQMTLPGVRDVMRRRLLDAAARQSSEAREALSARLLFRAWFYLTEDGVLVEHGGQYDPYCVFPYPMAPYHKETRAVQPTLGSLATRLMTSRMGYFNPHVDATYELTAAGYITHWLRFYVGSKNSLLFAWMGGSLRTFMTLVRARDHGSPERRRANLSEAARETGIPEAKLEEHAALFATPVELAELRRVARELWVDRVTLTAVSTAWAAGWAAFAPLRLKPVGLLGFLVFGAYEVISPKTRVRDRWSGVDRRALDIARVHGARAVLFGHTHHPHGYWEDGVFIGNAGSWSSAFYDIECKRPVFPERPLLWLTAEDGELSGGLMFWTGASFEQRDRRPAHERP